MVECKDRTSRIHLLVEGELGSDAAGELREHISSCPFCSDQFDAFLRVKQLVESALAAKVAYRDSEQEIMQKAAATDDSGPVPRRKRSFLRGLLLMAAASLAALVGGVYLFAHIYFHKTFSYQQSRTVNRCSEGIERKSPGAEWRKLSACDQLEKGMLLRMPAGRDCFLSYDRMRLLTKGETQLEVKDRRVLDLQKGSLFVATVRTEEPLKVFAGKTLAETNGGAFRIERADGTVTVGVTSGVVAVTTPGGTSRQLAKNQVGTFHDDRFSVASKHVKDPLERLKVSVIDRIRERFTQVMSKYAPSYRLSRMLRRLGAAGILEALQDPGGMLQFASYSPRAGGRSHFKLAQTSAERFSSYYDSLFVPSNRTLSLGRQKLVPLGPGKAASLPAWSHDGSMIAYIEYTPLWWPAVVKVARLDDLDDPWTISQEIDWVRPMFPVAWTPDDRHVIFQAQLTATDKENDVRAEFGIRIAPIDPAEGPMREFKSPLPDIPFQLPLPIGGTISPCIVSLPWGDAVLCGNWGNIAYIPIEPDGTPVSSSPGLFLSNFNPRETYVVAAYWSPSANKIIFMAVSNIGFTSTTYDNINVYILYDVDDILDGFTEPPRTIDDPRIKHISPTKNTQYVGGFSFDESLVFYQEDVNNLWQGYHPTDFSASDFDLFYADALPGQPSKPTQIHLPGNQMFLRPSPEGNRLAYCNFDGDTNELRVISFGVEADMDMDLGGVIIDNSGTNLIVPPGALERNFKVLMSTPLSIEDEAEVPSGETHFFAMRLLDAKGLEHPKFIEPMTLTIRYTDEEVAGLDEDMLDIYYYDETDPDHPKWVALGGTVDPDHNEITVEIKHFSKFAVGGPAKGGRKRHSPR